MSVHASRADSSACNASAPEGRQDGILSGARGRVQTGEGPGVPHRRAWTFPGSDVPWRGVPCRIRRAGRQDHGDKKRLAPFRTPRGHGGKFLRTASHSARLHADIAPAPRMSHAPCRAFRSVAVLSNDTSGKASTSSPNILAPYAKAISAEARLCRRYVKAAPAATSVVTRTTTACLLEGTRRPDLQGIGPQPTSRTVATGAGRLVLNPRPALSGTTIPRHHGDGQPPPRQ